jgi:hypothetical protein
MTPDPALVTALATALGDAIPDRSSAASNERLQAVAASVAAHPAVAGYLAGLRPPGSHVVTRDTLEAALVRAFPVRPRVQSQTWGLRADVILAALAATEQGR